MGKFKNVSLFFKGFAMGAADVVPGVSGGTIAFITGIYEELLASISSINLGLIKTIRTEGIKKAWQAINGNFLAVLFAGIFTSILTLAKLVHFLLVEYPIPLWSFFFGLVLASVWLIGKTINKWNFKTILALLIGTIIAYTITILPAFADSDSLLYIFICGTIAICAMILPGISGSFILVLLGAYSAIIGAIDNLLSAIRAVDFNAIIANMTIVGTFLIGCIIGLLSFSKVLNYLFSKAKEVVLALLTGFLIGSLNKIWPWKETITSYIKHPGTEEEEIVPILQDNILPKTNELITGTPSYLVYSIVFFIVGISILVVLDQFSPKTSEK